MKNLSRTPSAWFSWRSKPDFRSCQITISYLSEIFFLIWKKCCYIQIFPNKVTVLIESFENRFEATPFFAILYRWRNCCVCCWQSSRCTIPLFNKKKHAKNKCKWKICQKIIKSYKTPPTIWQKSRPANCYATFSLEFEL